MNRELAALGVLGCLAAVGLTVILNWIYTSLAGLR
jgi:hypothetical protein